MRVRYLRFDIWVCLLFAFLAATGAQWLLNRFVVDSAYESYYEEKTIADGEIGGKAGEEIFRAESVEDMQSHDLFTIIVDGMSYYNDGGAFSGDGYWNIVPMPSGERIAARLNNESIQHMGESIYQGETILPVGQLVEEPLDETLAETLQRFQITRTDLYIDMRGEGGPVTKQSFEENANIAVQMIIGIAVFAAVHTFGSKTGIFPAFFHFRKKDNDEFER